jgi:diguanylate cyclase (GGDEF)-like protein
MPPIGKDLFLISKDEKTNSRIIKKLIENDYTISTSFSVEKGLGKVYETPPALILIHESLLKGKALKFLKSFKADNLFSHIPVILIVNPEWEKNKINWDSYPVEDYITTSFRPEEILNRVALCVTRFHRALDPNPLTRLPGNTSILREIQSALDLNQKTAISYVDVDNFKAFNDRYGFARGDEALRMTARILSNAIHGLKDDTAFIGHIGGDDFVFITPSDKVDDACKRIIAGFDSIVPSLYEEEDKKRGTIHSKDRSGKKKNFPIMSISIAVVINENSRLKHYGEVSEIASQLKKQVKKKSGSNYMVDRRKEKKKKKNS